MSHILLEQTKGWSEYELLDSGNGRRLERFGTYTLSRPDPQAIWKPHMDSSYWQKADALFEGSEKGKGIWVKKNAAMPDSWILHFQDISFLIKLTSFKHTGVFPEQCMNWEWMESKMRNANVKSQNFNSKFKILNLFGYTGVASLVCAEAGAEVTHVDASKPTITWARENQKASHLEDKPIRWIVDDALKFVQREVKRGVRYDGIIMDPPIYGHGPGGEIWDFQKSFPELMNLCRQVFSETPLFVIVNAYAISASALMLGNVLADYMKDLEGKIEVGELALEEKDTTRLLSTGIFARWSR
jgi:23S rRNA (cytosine1962-C5)-methyltransferase